METPKKTFLEKMLTSFFKDYEFLMTMPLGVRKYAAWGYILLTLIFGIILHFTLRTPDASNFTTPSLYLIVGIYGWALILGVLSALVFYIPVLRHKRWYQWSYFLFSFLAGGISSRGRIGDYWDWTDVIMFFGGALMLTYGMKFFNKASASIADEKVRLEREKAEMQSEITAAQKMQATLLPTIDHATAYYRVFGKTRPAAEVGGDYFDVVPLNDTKVAVAIGDVSGHNISAGLLMAITKSAFRTELKHCQYEGELPNLMQSLNETVLENTERRMFVSFECAMFDFAARKVAFVNAGHGMIARVRGSEVSQIYPKGMALGLGQKGIFGEETSDLATNDIFIFFTDGISEAMNHQKEEFGTERVFAEVKHIIDTPHTNLVPPQIYDALMNSVERFTAAQCFDDDATLVIVQIL